MSIRIMSILFACAGLFACGCGGGDVSVTQTGNPVSVVLQVRVDTLSQALHKPRTVNADSSVTSVTVTSATIVLTSFELSGSDDSALFESENPSVIDLDLTGGPIPIDTLLTGLRGIYSEFGFTMAVLSPDYQTLYSANPVLRDRSLAVRGYVNGDTSARFEFFSQVSAEQRRELNPPLDLSRTVSTGVVLTIAPAEWFRDTAGGFYDPRLPSNQSSIESRIEASFGVFEDPDLDGQTD